MCVFIFVMSDVPAEGSDELSLGVAARIVGLLVPGYDQLSVAEQLRWQQMLNHPIRKTAHFLEYAALGALTMNMLVQIARVRASSILGRGREVAVGSVAMLRRFAIAAWALSTLYAATDEVHQLFIAGRAGMLTDVLLDSFGVAVGVLLCTLSLRRLQSSWRGRSD